MIPRENTVSDDAAAPAARGSGQVIPLRPPRRWHDPLRLIEDSDPEGGHRIALWTLVVLVLALLVWAAVGQVDIIASAEGRLVPQTLLKVVQPAESGVVKELLVQEGDSVQAGQVLARLDPTLARAEGAGVASDLAMQRLQVRRIEAELAGRPMLFRAGDEPLLIAQVQSQYSAHRQAFLDSLAQEQSILIKAEHERKSAAQIFSKLEQTLPIYARAAESYGRLEREGFYGGLATADKQREALEKSKDLDAQRSTVAALDATMAAQRMRLSQIQSNYRSELQKELADIRARIAQLQPALDKSAYREGLMELRAPQSGTVKDLATTTVGAVVQPGTVVLTIVPKGEQLYADVAVKNEDVGFVHVGQHAQIKLAAYPFQRHGMLSGKVIHLSADARDQPRQQNAATGQPEADGEQQGGTYKARIALTGQTLVDPQGNALAMAPGMQVVAEISQGKRTVLEYLLSPVRKATQEAARER